MKKQTAYAFFLSRAGFSWRPGKETREQGRRRCARELARAEERGTALGWSAQWAEDYYADRSWLDQEGYDDDDRENAEFYYCIVLDYDGAVLASLHGIHEDRRDPQGARDYRRVVRAELFDQALAELGARGGAA